VEEVVAYFKILSYDSHGRTEEIHETSVRIAGLRGEIRIRDT
jgi:hypothetical protein